MTIYIGIDDTDNRESRGTGHLARQIVARLSSDYTVLGVIRHQLLVDPQIPYTSHNSSAAILLDGGEEDQLETLFGSIKEMILDDFQPGSDPGLCVTREVPLAIIDFGRRAQRQVVSRREALELAAENGIFLEGLGGTNDGVIGALAAVGLAASGEDGRYIFLGKIREMSGQTLVGELLNAGITAVQTMDGEQVSDGLVASEKLRPARRGGKPVQYVAWQDGVWHPLKLD